jgi:hypothetical protein
MELNISELHNGNTMNPYQESNMSSYEEENADNYWIKTNTQQKKKKVTFNDILSNMNLVVNKNGSLEFMSIKQNEVYTPQSQPQYSQQQYSQQQYSQPQYSQPQYSQPQYSQQQYSQQQYSQKQYSQKQYSQPQYSQQQYNSETIDPSIKNSYIYNKYFKEYSDPNAGKPEHKVPKTIEEYRKMLMDDRINAIIQKQRIEQIKSKKLLFTTVPGSYENTRNIRASKNNLRSMNFS